MSLLSSITTGRSSRPPRLMVYGQEGVGKSTFASQAPNVIFVQVEDGLDQIEASKFPKANSFKDVIDQLDALRVEAHSFSAIAIDSLDWLERLIHDQVCADFGVKSIEKADGGYGKGYVHAIGHWRKVLLLLDALREKGMAIILIAHSKVERFADPENPEYDRYAPRLHKSASALVTEWADAVLFATRKMRVSKEGDRAVASSIGADGGERILRANGSPACVAKNRFSMPNEIPLSFDAVMQYL